MAERKMPKTFWAIVALLEEVHCLPGDNWKGVGSLSIWMHQFWRYLLNNQCLFVCLCHSYLIADLIRCREPDPRPGERQISGHEENKLTWHALGTLTENTGVVQSSSWIFAHHTPAALAPTQLQFWRYPPAQWSGHGNPRRELVFSSN